MGRAFPFNFFSEPCYGDRYTTWCPLARLGEVSSECQPVTQIPVYPHFCSSIPKSVVVSIGLYNWNQVVTRPVNLPLSCSLRYGLFYFYIMYWGFFLLGVTLSGTQGLIWLYAWGHSSWFREWTWAFQIIMYLTIWTISLAEFLT